MLCAFLTPGTDLIQEGPRGIKLRIFKKYVNLYKIYILMGRIDNE